MSFRAMMNQRTMAKCQANYDHMEPPEYYEDDRDEEDDEQAADED